MKAKFDYILYKANGEKQIIARGVERKKWEELKDILGARTLEIVPKEYVDKTIDEDLDIRATFYMDEEARLKDETNVRNNWFKVIGVQKKQQDEFAELMGFVIVEAPMPEHNGIREYDIVGDVIMEKRNGQIGA